MRGVPHGGCLDGLGPNPVCRDGDRHRQYRRLISLDELLPTSRAYGKGHDSLFGLVAGMFVMSLSLLLMK